MSQMGGQSRSFDDVCLMSGLPPKADPSWTSRHVRIARSLPPFAERALRNICRGPRHSALMFANFTSMDNRVCQGLARSRLDRRYNRLNRLPLGRGTQQPVRRISCRARSEEGQRHCHSRNRTNPCRETRDSQHSDRFRGHGRPGWHGFGRKSRVAGRYVTGLSNQSADLNGKRIDLLREVAPNLRKLALMANVASPIGVLEMREVEEVCRILGLEVFRLEIQRAEDIEPAIEKVRGRADALVGDRAACEHEPYAH
jgi:hypothetical protein